MERYTISFAGAGRVGAALCNEFFKAGHRIDTIVSRTEKIAKKVAGECNAEWSTVLQYPDSTEIIIVAVPDNSLREVLENIKCSSDTLVAHTAGSYGLDVFPARIRHTGVLYPLQTFSHNRSISFNDLPFIAEASDDKTTGILNNCISSVGGKVHYADAVHRRMLHLAAVFACNFTNHMLTDGRDLAIRAGFSFDILKPLINETISKALDAGPENSQTGPAMRNDSNTIVKHLDLLSFSPELREVYSGITESIIKYYKNHSVQF